MKRYPSMSIARNLLLACMLAAAACGGKESVASKSDAAYREAQAKGIPVGGGHDHGGHGATATTTGADHSAHGATTAGAVDHSAHGATAAGAVDHSAHGATAAGAVDHSAHGATAAGAVDHGGHGAAGAVDHAAMGHSAGATDAHAGHGATSRTAAADHGAMDHGSSRSTTNAHAGHTGAAPTGAADAHARHGTQTATAQVEHSQHGAAQTPAAPEANAHAQHGTAATARPAAAPPPRSNAEMQRLQPRATLSRDAFDAPAPASVAEAAKASQSGGHEGHQMRGITPGQDRENPPTPVPATRDGNNRAVAVDHSEHGARPGAATLYVCPMHPEVTSDEPGKCPKCAMTLVKKQ